MLKRNANNDKTVILAVVDNSYVEMAINLLGYFHGKNIRNFLFICTDEESALRLKRYGIYPFLYENALVSKTASVLKDLASFAQWSNLYQSNRELSDEIRYVFDRKKLEA